MMMSEFVKTWEAAINRGKANRVILPFIIELESKVTLFEINQLIKTYTDSELEVSKETLQPFVNFLDNRWARVGGTDADYVHKPETFANSACVKLGRALVRRIENKYNVKNLTYAEEQALLQDASLYLMRGNPQSIEVDPKEKQAVLQQRVLACIKSVITTRIAFIKLMTESVDKSEWQSFLKDCDLSFLKNLFLPKATDDNIYDAITASTVDDNYFYGNNHECNDALMFCLLEIYKRQRDQGPKYTGFFGGFTGVPGSTRVAQARHLQEFIVSGESDLKQFMKKFKEDERCVLSGSGHVNALAVKTANLRNDRYDSSKQVATTGLGYVA